MNLTTLLWIFQEKQALVMRQGQEIWMLKVKNRSIFHQLLYHVPQENLVEHSPKPSGGEVIS